jgi:hypothetical protein
MKQKKRLSDAENQEMFSANENIYDMFSIEELEQRLQMSEARPWCSVDCPNDCETLCNPLCYPLCLPLESCAIDGCTPITTTP